MYTDIKKCTAEDVGEICGVAVKTFCETFEAVNDPETIRTYLEKAFSVEKMYRELKDPNSDFFLLYSNGVVAGYLKLNEAESQTEINDVSSLEIERIYVLDKFQGKGFGRLLMQKALVTAAERKKEYVWLGVWEKNEKAITFYEKNGFYKIGSHSFLLGNEAQNDYIMRKNIK